MNKYGMRYFSIRYWQNQAKSLWLHNGIVAGSGVFVVPNQIAIRRPDHIGHAAIQVAAVCTPEETRQLLNTGDCMRFYNR